MMSSVRFGKILHFPGKCHHVIDFTLETIILLHSPFPTSSVEGHLSVPHPAGYRDTIATQSYSICLLPSDFTADCSSTQERSVFSRDMVSAPME